MPNFTLNRNKKEVLKVKIDGKEYSIPLGFSLKRKELAKLDKEAEVMKFFEKYLGKEVMDDLSIGELKQIIDAWAKATQAEATGGESLGE